MNKCNLHPAPIKSIGKVPTRVNRHDSTREIWLMNGVFQSPLKMVICPLMVAEHDQDDPVFSAKVNFDSKLVRVPSNVKFRIMRVGLAFLTCSIQHYWFSVTLFVSMCVVVFVINYQNILSMGSTSRDVTVLKCSLSI